MSENDQTHEESQGTEEDATSLILSKLDSLQKQIDELKPKTDAKPEDPEITLAKDNLRALLKGKIAQAKLDSYTLPQLNIAAQIVADMPAQRNLPSPPQGKGSTKKEDAVQVEWGLAN